MKQYRVELGFDWNSSPITGSSITVGSTGNTVVVRPLQIALVNISSDGTPAFFTGFAASDQLNFWIFDITDILNGTPAWSYDSSVLTVKITQNGSDANPFSSPNQWHMAPQPGQQSSYAFSTKGQQFGFAPVNAVINGQNQDWATFAAVNQPETYELSVELELTLSGESRTFVTDPELIVGETGTGG